MDINLKTIKDIDALDIIENKISNALNERRKELKLNVEAFNATNDSFIYIKESIENMSPVLFKTKQGRKILSCYKNIVNSNKDLKKLFEAYNNITSLNNKENINNVLKDIKKHTGVLNTKCINEGINELNGVLFAAYKELGDNAVNYLFTEKKEFGNAIRYILENKEKLTNISKFNNAGNIIKEEINKTSPINDDNTYTEITENKEIVFNTYKNECLKKLTESISLLSDESDINKIQAIYEQVENKKFNDETVDNDIVNLIGITKCLD